MDPQSNTVDWDELDKTKFYTYGITFFVGVRAMLYPPFLIKTKIQVDKGRSSNSFSVARDIVRTEGPRGLYKGFWVSSVSIIFRQVYFTVYEVIRHRLGPDSATYKRLGETKGETLRNMVAGAGSSSMMQVFTVPLDVVSQVSGCGCDWGAATAGARSDLNARQVIREIYRESGLGGFYRGFHVSVLQFAPTSAIWCTAYAFYNRAIYRSLAPLALTLDAHQQQVMSQAAAGFCTGMTTAALTNPLDVLRTRLQVEGKRGDNRTIGSEFRVLMREDGHRGLMRGLGPRLVAMAPASALVITVYELIKRLSQKTP
ncbi:unnamed protein product, partial [Discosporangium mesarthrocarpum]